MAKVRASGSASRTAVGGIHSDSTAAAADECRANVGEGEPLVELPVAEAANQLESRPERAQVGHAVEFRALQMV